MYNVMNNSNDDIQATVHAATVCTLFCEYYPSEDDSLQHCGGVALFCRTPAALLLKQNAPLRVPLSWHTSKSSGTPQLPQRHCTVHSLKLILMREGAHQTSELCEASWSLVSSYFTQLANSLLRDTNMELYIVLVSLVAP